VQLKQPKILFSILAVAAGLVLSLPGQEAGKRGIKIEPVATAGADRGSAALFVGVNEFEESNVTPLRYAVNDAIAQANLFVEELKLVPAENCWLALSGTPDAGSPWEKTLNNLKSKGVSVISATKISVLRQLRLLSRKADRAEELLIVSISTHGFEDSGTPYALGSDGLLGPVLLPETGISLRAVEGLMEQSLAQKRLLILDACRERPTRGSRSIGVGAAAEAFRAAFDEAAGRAVLASCDAGQASFEDPRLGHGVFTYHLIEGLRGAAEADGDFLTLGGVSDYVSQSVESWVRKNKPELPRPQWQRPWFKGPNDARQIPLALATLIQPVIEPKFKLTPEMVLGERKKQALLYLQQATAFGLENQIPGEYYQKANILISVLEGETLEYYLSTLELLKDNTPENRGILLEKWKPKTSEDTSASNANSNPTKSVELDFAPVETKSLTLDLAEEPFRKADPENSENIPEPTPEPIREAPVLSPTPTPTPIRKVDKPETSLNGQAPKTGTAYEIPELGLKMVWIPAGDFEMGTRLTEKGRGFDEFPHKVQITQGFWLGKFEVTVGEWNSVMGISNAGLKPDDQLVAMGDISWDQAAEFCKKLQARELAAGRIPSGYQFSLPTEAEWEYACRASTTTFYPFGNSSGIRNAYLKQFAWFIDSSKRNANPVGQKSPNDWGLYDMLGNVREYCWDDFGSYSRDNNQDPILRLKKSNNKVNRGGSYLDEASRCRPAYRSSGKRDKELGPNYGFRLALSPVARD
jgi:formylglycine-generating enzyme required for sulfatase activity